MDLRVKPRAAFTGVAFLVLSLCSCTTLPRLFESEESRLERQLRPLLLRHAVTDSEFKEALQAIDSTGRKAIGVRWRGVNVDANDGVAAYVVDAKSLEEDPSLCGKDRANSLACARVSAIRDNCAVISPRTIACDAYLLWRIERTAYRLAIGSLKAPGPDGAYYFDRASLRRKFFIREEAFPPINEMSTNLRLIRETVASGVSSTVAEPFKRVRAGFIEMILLHEIGHIVHEDLGEATPRCNSSSRNEKSCDVCAHASLNEMEADEFAVSELSKEISPERFTPARASPEFWVEEFYRREYRALTRLHRPLDWAPSNPAEAREFEEVSMIEVATCRHPAWLARYLSLMEVLRKSGIQFNGSKESLEYANEFVTAIDSYCKQNCHDH